jgi:hypothetical protein
MQNFFRHPAFRSRLTRNMSGGRHPGHWKEINEPSKFHTNVGKALLIVTYLWIFYRFKQDGPQLFGFYKPWEHDHDHEHEDDHGHEAPKRRSKHRKSKPEHEEGLFSNGYVGTVTTGKQ